MKVPVYTRQVAEPSTPTTRQQGLPGASFGEAQAQQAGQVSQALGSTAGVMSQVAAGMKARNDQAWLSSTSAEFREYSDTYLYDPDKGVLNTQLEASQGITKQTAADLDTKLKELADKAPTPELGAALNTRLAEFRATQLRTSARHEGGQLTKWETMAAEEDANLASATWMRDWSSSAEEYDTTFQRTVVPTLQRVSDATGKPVDALIREQHAKGRANMIYQNIAAGALGKARELKEKWGKELLPDDSLKIEAIMRKKDIEMKSDNLANDLFDKVQTEELTPAQAREQLRGEKDTDVRNRARSKYRSLESDFRVQQREESEELTISYVDQVDEMSGSLSDQQDYVLGLPENTAPERKAKKAAMQRYNLYAKGEGVAITSDAAAFERVTDGIISGDVTLPNQITGSDDGALLAVSDRKQLVSMLKQKQTLTLAKRQFMATMGKKYKAKQWAEFLPYAMERVTATNKGDDPEYIQTLIDTWHMSGETKNMLAFGWGRDKEFGKAYDDPSWLPSIPAEDAAEFNAQFDSDPVVRAAWLRLYNGNEDAARRAAYKQAKLSQTMSEAELQQRVQ